MELAVRLRTALSAKPDADLKSVRCRHSLKTKLIYDKGSGGGLRCRRANPADPLMVCGTQRRSMFKALSKTAGTLRVASVLRCWGWSLGESIRMLRMSSRNRLYCFRSQWLPTALSFFGRGTWEALFLLFPCHRIRW